MKEKEKYELDENNYTPSHIANYLLLKAEQDKKPLTPMKLIKMVYITYGWYLAVYKKRLFAEKIEAWRYGPVIPSLYHEFKRFGSSEIDDYSFSVEFSEDGADFSANFAKENDVLSIATNVWEFYKNKSGSELSRITHEDDSAWQRAYQQGLNTPLDNDDIFERSKIGIVKYLKTIKKD
jgi:uncharacterized phage-associated protein